MLKWDAKSQLWPIIQGLESYRKFPGKPGHDPIKWDIYCEGESSPDMYNGPEAIKIDETLSDNCSNDPRKDLYYIYLYIYYMNILPI